MNIHPIVIHFPIACLVLYTGLELLSLFVKSRRDKLYLTKIILLIIGTIWAFMAIQTGEYAWEQLGYTDLIEAHSEFGEMSYRTYLIIWIIYACQYMLATKSGMQIMANSFGAILGKIIKFASHPILLSLIALLGLVLLSITGALGGAISHGIDTDPVVRIVYDLIIK